MLSSKSSASPVVIQEEKKRNGVISCVEKFSGAFESLAARYWGWVNQWCGWKEEKRQLLGIGLSLCLSHWSLCGLLIVVCRWGAPLTMSVC